MDSKIIKTVSFLIYMLIEQRLGRTDHGSVLDLAKNVILDTLKLDKNKRGSTGMNTELKAILGVVFGMIKVGKDLVEKKGLTEMLPDLEKLGLLIIPVVSNYQTLLSELQALPGSANEADLIEFTLAEFALVSGDARAQLILAAALKMAGNVVVDSMALAEAIKGISPAPAAITQV